jgi:hypothetical protein
MLRIHLILSLGLFITISANAQPTNDEPCNAITLTVAPNIEECTPTQAIQWSAATATNIANPACGSGQLQDVWYKFTAPVNGKVNIRVSLPVGATNDGVIAVYSAAACTGSFTEVGCNDDYIGLNPGLSLTGLAAAQIYYIRFWSLGSSAGNYLICLCNPAPSPPAIDPNKRIGINYDFPEANLDVNGTLMVRGGNPQPGRVLTAINEKGKMEWKDIVNQVPQPIKRLFQTGIYGQYTNTENSISFFNKVYDIGNGLDLVNNKYVIQDSIGSIYQFTLCVTTSQPTTNNLNSYPKVYFNIYQNNVLKKTFVHTNVEKQLQFSTDTEISSNSYTFELATISNHDEIRLTIVSNAFGNIAITTYSPPLYNIGGNSSFFSGQKIY